VYPEPINETIGLTRRQLEQARRVQADVELALHRHELQARMRAEFDRHDSQALGDASRNSLQEELDLLDYGLARAGVSAAKLELVHRTVDRMSRLNNARMLRRFGG
jgi:hypothetical protein